MERILEPKTELLAAVAAATAGKCQRCFAKLHGVARDVGVTDAELRAAVDVGTRVSTRSHEFMLAFIAETTGGTVRAPGADRQGGCGCN